LKLKFISIRKAQAEEEKIITHTQVQRSDFRDSAKVKRLRQNWSRDVLRLNSDNLRRGCRLQDSALAQCKGTVRADGVSSLIVAAGERCGLLKVGFESMMRSWVMK